MNILMISPASPPKNSPEAMQVGRFLQELDKYHTIILATTPIEKGWVIQDNSLQYDFKNIKILELKLPFHNKMIRLLSSKYFKFFALPDKDFWIKCKLPYILNKVTNKPDVIYSRSMPFSSALLALRLKRKTKLPWVMHLSDPFIDNPYRKKSFNEKLLVRYEYECFNEANYITVTTENLLKFYQKKYPLFSKKIKLSSNVMPIKVLNTKIDFNIKIKDKIQIFYAGALYEKRNFTTILDALEILKKQKPTILTRLDIIIAGNMTDIIKQEIIEKNFEQITILGRLNYEKILKIQDKVDIVVSIEPDGDNPILKSFLPSKILDYLAVKKPILAITPKGSESWDICNKYNFGWAIEPNDSKKLAILLENLVLNTNETKNIETDYKLLDKYNIENCVLKLNKLFDKSIKKETI